MKVCLNSLHHIIAADSDFCTFHKTEDTFLIGRSITEFFEFRSGPLEDLLVSPKVTLAFHATTGLKHLIVATKLNDGFELTISPVSSPLLHEGKSASSSFLLWGETHGFYFVVFDGNDCVFASESWLKLLSDKSVTRSRIDELYEELNSSNDYIVDKYIEGHLCYFVLIDRENNQGSITANNDESSFYRNLSFDIRTPLSGVIGVLELLKNPSFSRHKDVLATVERASQELFQCLSIISSNYDPNHSVKDQRFNAVDLDFIYRTLENLLGNNSHIPLNINKDEKTNLQKLIEIELQAFTYLAKELASFIHGNFNIEAINADIILKEQLSIIIKLKLAEDVDKLDLIEKSLQRLAKDKQYVDLLGDLKLDLESKRSILISTLLKASALRVHTDQVNSGFIIEPERKPLKILIVDDNDINRKVLSLMLDTVDIDYDLAVDGIESLELVKEKDYDIVVMDIQMPLMNGFDAANEIKKIRPKLPVVALTAYGSRENFRQAIDSGMDDFLVKPIRKDALYEMIEAHTKFKVNF